MRIDRLVPDPRRPGSTRVVVDRQTAWTVPADVIAALGLVPGASLNGAAMERLELAADEEAAFRSGVRHLERRGHARRELGRKLERKGHPEPAVASALARMDQLGLLDDPAFARTYAASRAGRGRSPTRIRRDLVALGVDPDDAQAAVAALASEDSAPDPLETTLAQARRRAASMATLPPITQKRRLLAFFARRGWSGEEARAQVDHLIRRR